MLRLHWSPDSANIVVRMALEAFGLPYEGVRVRRDLGGLRSAEFLALNPQGLIPVLEDGETVLFETGAILLHLADRVGRFGPEGPAADDAAARAAVLKWMFYLSNTVHADLRVSFYTARYLADPSGVPNLREGIARRLRGHLDLLEGGLTEAGGLAGPPGVLELYLGAMVRWAQIFPTGDPALPEGIGGWPRLHALMRAVEDMEPVRRAFAAEAIPAERGITAPRPAGVEAAEVSG